MNALRHGLRSTEVVLPSEDSAVFEELRNAVHAELSPKGIVEELLADRIVISVWRLRRLGRVETGLFSSGIHDIKTRVLVHEMVSYTRPTLGCTVFDKPVITDEEAHRSAQEKLAALNESHDRSEVDLALAFQEDATKSDTFAKLTRYEAGIERAFFRNLRELRQLQEERRRNRSPVIDAE